MLNLLFEQINDRLEALPERLKEAIFSPAIDSAIIRICQGYRLSDEKISLVAQNVGEVLFGFESYKNLASDLQADLSIDNRLATAITSDIWSKILSPYREELESAYSPIAPTIEKTILSSPPIDLRPKEEPLPSAPEAKKPSPTKPEAKPEPAAILFKPEAPVTTPATPETKKPSLGGLFAIFAKKEKKPAKEKVKAQIETPHPSLKGEGPKIAKTEAPTFKVVHYTQFEPQAPSAAESPKMIFGAEPAIPIVPQPPLIPKPTTPAFLEESRVMAQKPPEEKPPTQLAQPEQKEMEEKEMIDLETLQKVKIKVEPEKPKPSNEDIVDLRK